MARRAAFREPQRPLLFALALLIHAGLFQLLVSQRPENLQAPERSTALALLPDTKNRAQRPPPIAPLAPEQLPAAPLPATPFPQLIAPSERDATHEPASVDWQRQGEEVAREHALESQKQPDHKNDGGPPKPKPEFGWDRSRAHRVEPLEGGGVLVRINDRCAVVITLIAMPVCQIGTKPARGDLFEHMRDAPTLGDWKDE
ncbi:MAG TPA: hypothetical protein VN705_17120 [Steroidobacteraceae bacterium]|nr:hypothetical protein [Steroidobacteraceae bacterium]